MNAEYAAVAEPALRGADLVEFVPLGPVPSEIALKSHDLSVAGRGTMHLYDASKRLIDLTLASLTLVLTLPLIGGIALAIWMDDRGPIVYRQQRTGRHGRRFTLRKFRTMCVNADEMKADLQKLSTVAWPDFKLDHDPRITRVGRLLRATYLDELPQLLNVLCGHMSLVGPRPPLPHEVAVYEERMRRRLLVKPGMTGLWQVTGRSDLSWEESVRLDVYYAENWTPFLDLLILAQTARAVISGRGAY
jgi:lipopolysaccharide/colanic/teichoic acid biosynthesis glycosyltransferase